MVHPEDLDIFGRITGHRTLTPEFESEYAIWLKMHHRNKRQGGLGDLMIPLLRSLKIGPPDEVVDRKKTDWTKVEIGTRVIINTDSGPREGQYVGLRDFGILAVRYDGDPMIRHANPYQAVLADDEEVVAVMPAPEPPKPERQVQHQAPPTIADDEEEIADYQPGVDDPDPTGEKPAPVLESKEWYKRATGSQVYVQDGVDTAEGQLVSIGPEDGQITVWVDGEDEARVFQESDVFAG